MVLQHDVALEGLTVVDIAELRARCHELVDEAVAGRDPVVVTSDGRPLARLERYVPPARVFYVRASPEGDGASERVYRETVETLHRSLTVPEFQACCAELVEQTHAKNWTVLIWNRPDAMLTRYRPVVRHRDSGYEYGDLVAEIRELRDEMAAETERSLDRNFPP